MSDIVIIPSSWRAEFLYLCLEALSKCPEISDKEIWIVQDHKPTDDQFPEAIKDTTEVIDMWKGKLGSSLIPMIRPVNEFYGNTYNVLSAYNKAYKTDANYVYLIEDDLVVTPDFFEWHEWAQNSKCFCSIGSNLVNFDMPYRSLGVCWKRENLSSIIEHYKPEYYTSDQSMVDYVWEKFPNSKYGYKFIEQDGLICRIMERDNRFILWSIDKTRCYHIGLWGYHRSIGLKAMQEAGLIDNPLMTRIQILKKLLRNKEWLELVADFQTDIQVLPNEF